MELGSVNPDDFTVGRQAELDATLLVKFFIEAMPDREATEKEGRPMFKDTEMIDIRVPGSRNNVVRPASQRDINRFPKHYELFKARVDGEYVEGTLLKEWPMLTRSQAEELGFLNVRTVEQLAAMSDGTQFMGLQKLKNMAKDWLAKQEETGNLKEELAERDEQLAALKAELEELKKAVSTVTKKTPRKKKTTAKKE